MAEILKSILVNIEFRESMHLYREDTYRERLIERDFIERMHRERLYREDA